MYNFVCEYLFGSVHVVAGLGEVRCIFPSSKDRSIAAMQRMGHMC